MWLPPASRGRTRPPLITPVDRDPANPFGVHHMIGNNWEWVRDYSSADYSAAQVRRPESSVEASRGPASSHERMLRGAGWNVNSDRATCSFRSHADPPVYHSDHVSLRVVRKP